VRGLPPAAEEGMTNIRLAIRSVGHETAAESVASPEHTLDIIFPGALQYYGVREYTRSGIFPFQYTSILPAPTAFLLPDRPSSICISAPLPSLLLRICLL
jgi:hypothetical protein